MELNAYMLEHHSPERIGGEYIRYFSEILAAPKAQPRPATLPASILSNATGAYMAARWSAAEKGLRDEIAKLKSALQPPALRSPRETGVAAGAETAMPWARSMDLAPLMKASRTIMRSENGIVVLPRSEPGHRLFGPNLPISAGRYILATDLSVDWRDRIGRGIAGSHAVAEIVWNVDTILAQKSFKVVPTSSGAFSWRELFEITGEHVDASGGGLEIRVWTDGRVAWRVGQIVLSAETPR